MVAGGSKARAQRGRPLAVAVALVAALAAGLWVVLPTSPARASAPPLGATAAPAPTSLAGEAATARARLEQTATAPHAGTPVALAHPADDHAGSTVAAGSGSATIHPEAVRTDASTYPLGLDVYSGTGAVNWSQVAANGADFAYVKATEDVDYTNPLFAQQYNGAANAGLVRGAYHFAVPSDSSGAAQADYFVSNGGGWTPDGVTLPGALDIEANPGGPECYGLSQPAMVAWIADFSREYHILTGRNPVLYTGYYFWSDCTGGSSAFNGQDPLWFPRYGPSVAPLPAGFTSYAIWQNADSGQFPGDQDQFNGSGGNLHSFATYGGLSQVCLGTLGSERVPPPVTGIAPTPDGQGYWEVDADGGVAACGDATFEGSPTVTSPVVGIAAGPDDRGYYLVGADGGVFAYGSATFHGSMGGHPLAKPVVGIAIAGNGYWLVASDGGIFSFNVPFHGSAGGLPLVKPVVGMAADPDTGGYWLVASDGGIFSYGGAPFRGSAASLRLVRPVVGMSTDTASDGYRLVAADGGIFSYGATFYGSAGGVPLVKPVDGMATPPGGPGYWLVASDGGVFNYGAPFYGSTG